MSKVRTVSTVSTVSTVHGTVGASRSSAHDAGFELAIIGGGPAGASLAVVAAEAGRRVLLVDQLAETAGRAEGPPSYKIGEGLPGAGRMLLDRLGVRDAFLEQGHLPSYANHSYWGGATCRSVDFIRDPHGHAWHLDRLAFDALLRRRAAELGADLWTGTKLLHLDRDAAADPWQLRLRRGAAELDVRADFVVDATGRVARVSAELGIERRKDDELVGFHRLFRCPHPDADASTCVEAVEDGWWYTAPLPGAVRVVAFFTDADLEPCRHAADPDGFTALVDRSAHLKVRLASHGYEPLTPPRAAPSHSGCSSSFVGAGHLAVGDAATAFDPLSSQGIYTAMHNGIVAGEAWVRHLSGDTTALAAYAGRVTTIYDTYLRNRNAYYAMEGRFTGRPFWRRRVL